MPQSQGVALGWNLAALQAKAVFVRARCLFLLVPKLYQRIPARRDLPGSALQPERIHRASQAREAEARRSGFPARG
jgi:hypothetical protein